MKKQLVALVLMGILLSLVGCGTAVPDVKGMTVEAATKALQSTGFEVGKVTYDELSSMTRGAVFEQEPAADKRAKAGSLVILTIAGPPPVSTPDLSGLDEEKATATLDAVGLKLGDVTESYNATIVAGNIISHEPAAGIETPNGSAVALVISTGPEPVAVPVVTGKTQADATKLLEAAGFKVKIATTADDAKKGTVIAQKPAEGKAQPGTTVSITVSTGVEMVTVPKVIGMYPDAASARLRNAGLGVKVVDIHGPIDSDAGNADFGEVYRQTPKAGSVVPKGTTVEIRSWWEAG